MPAATVCRALSNAAQRGPAAAFATSASARCCSSSNVRREQIVPLASRSTRRSSRERAERVRRRVAQRVNRVDVRRALRGNGDRVGAEPVSGDARSELDDPLHVRVERVPGRLFALPQISEQRARGRVRLRERLPLRREPIDLLHLGGLLEQRRLVRRRADSSSTATGWRASGRRAPRGTPNSPSAFRSTYAMSAACSCSSTAGVKCCSTRVRESRDRLARAR